MEEAESEKNGTNRGAAWLIAHLPVDLNSHPTKKGKAISPGENIFYRHECYARNEKGSFLIWQFRNFIFLEC